MKALKVSSSKGNEYGHVPGHQYRDVDVTIVRTRKGNWTVEILETWGSAQGYDEEHGRKKVIGRGNSLDGAVRDARTKAHEADIDREYMTQSLSCAEAEAAEEAEAADASEGLPAELTISVEIKDEEMAKRVVDSLIEWERSLRSSNGVSGHIPVTAEVKLADSIRDARRNLQEVAKLVDVA